MVAGGARDERGVWCGACSKGQNDGGQEHWSSADAGHHDDDDDDDPDD